MARIKRQHLREPADFELVVYWEFGGGQVGSCQPQARDLSDAGMRLQSPIRIEPGMHVFLDVARQGFPLEGTIRYCVPDDGEFRIGVEFSSFSLHFQALTGERVDIEPVLYRLRRRKDADELARLKKAIAACGKMYALARQIIEPGIAELEVFNRLQAAAVDEIGEKMSDHPDGNDFACGARGGPPRGGRTAQDGELYILDLGPACRGYFADTCRAIAVNKKPTEEQQTAWTYIMKVFEHLNKTVRAGKSCQELYHEAQEILAEAPIGVFNHHLGHGIGLFPHEGPHLNPFWNDSFETGDVFTAEPGLYDEKILRAGMRLENNYLVTETGVELLSDFPLEL